MTIYDLRVFEKHVENNFKETRHEKSKQKIQITRKHEKFTFLINDQRNKH